VAPVTKALYPLMSFMTVEVFFCQKWAAADVAAHWLCLYDTELFLLGIQAVRFATRLLVMA
jgi:hypothetical protein